jgi:cardiolipin synthase
MPRLNNKQAPTFSSGNRVELVPGGKGYFDLLLRLIGKARETIHLQTYIFDDDSTGVTVASALKSAAKRGVQVYLMVDGYASQFLSRQLIGDMRNGGVHFRFFEPFFRSRNFYFGRRMHHKVFVADALHSLTGGINIADRYNDAGVHRPWLDFAVYAEGDVSRELCELCWKTWNALPVQLGPFPCEAEKSVRNSIATGNMMARVRRNDWVRRRNEISSTYIQMLRNARSEVTILCSYFLPGKIIRRLLAQAARRGVRIRVITAGPSDVMLSKYAERWMYDWLLRNKIEIYEYQPVILHAKVAVCDSEWMTIGSYNVNNISAYASIELNIDVRNEDFAKLVNTTLEEIIRNDTVAITAETHRRNRNPFVQFVRWFSYQFIRATIYIVTCYYRPRV